MERKLAAILSADVVAFSRLMEQDESGTFMRLRSYRKELFEPEIAKHRGRIFKLMGDGLLAEFDSVVDAVECAVLLQRAMAKRNASRPAGRRLEIRIGINLGDVILDGEDRYGEGVNIASRLQQLASPGGICVTRTVYDHVRHKLVLAFEDAGEHKVKNLAEPISVFRIIVGAAPSRSRAVLWSRRLQPTPRAWVISAAAVLVVSVLGWLGFSSSSLLERQGPASPAQSAPFAAATVAVLPFTNMSSDRELDYLADGITKAVIGDLTRSGRFRVPSRVFRSRAGEPIDVRQVGRESGAQYVLGGSVHKGANQLRAVAQLIDTRTGDHVWGGRYDGPPGDILAFQDEASAQIVALLASTAGLSGSPGAAARQLGAESAVDAAKARKLPQREASAKPPDGSSAQPARVTPAAPTKRRGETPPQQLGNASPGVASKPSAKLPVHVPLTTSRAVPAAPALDSALVILIQDRLRSLGYDPGPVDGKIGQRTRSAISSYQTRHGLTSDGLPSRELLEHLQRQTRAQPPPPEKPPSDPTELPPAPSPLATPPAPQQAARTETAYAAAMADPSLVFLIQHRLRELGFAPSRLDGRMDRGTADAIRAYQEKRQLPMNGLPSRQLLERMERDVAMMSTPPVQAAQPHAPNMRSSLACADEGAEGLCDALSGQLEPAPSLGSPAEQAPAPGE